MWKSVCSCIAACSVITSHIPYERIAEHMPCVRGFVLFHIRFAAHSSTLRLTHSENANSCSPSGFFLPFGTAQAAMLMLPAHNINISRNHRAHQQQLLLQQLLLLAVLRMLGDFDGYSFDMRCSLSGRSVRKCAVSSAGGHPAEVGFL